MSSPTRTFVNNLNRLRAHPEDAVEILIFLADEESIDYLNDLIADFDNMNAAEAEKPDGRVFVTTYDDVELDVTHVHAFSLAAFRSYSPRPSKVDVIKELRRVTGFGLKEAKNTVDTWWEQHRAADQGLGESLLRDIENRREAEQRKREENTFTPPADETVRPQPYDGPNARASIEAGRPPTIGDLIRDEMDRQAPEHGIDDIDDIDDSPFWPLT